MIEAYEARQKQKAWEMYLCKFQHMTKENFITFEDFWDKIIAPKQPQKSDEELRKDIERVKKIHQSKGGDR